MNRPLVALAALALSAAQADAQSTTAPCVEGTAACTGWVTVGGGPGRSLVYRSYPLDVRNDAITNVLVVVHGAGRNPDDYFRSGVASAFLAGKLDRALVIAPRMASNDGRGCRDELAPDEISWNCQTWRSGGPSTTHPAVTSFDFLDDILRQVARKDVFPNLKAIVVTGHSAGGQVTNRYGMSNALHDALGVPVSYGERARLHPGRRCGRPPVPVAGRRERVQRIRPVGLRIQEPHRVHGEAQRRATRAAARLASHHVPPGPGGHPPPERLRQPMPGHGAGTHPTGPGPGVRPLREREAGREPQGGGGDRVRAQRTVHVHLEPGPPAALPGLRVQRGHTAPANDAGGWTRCYANPRSCFEFA